MLLTFVIKEVRIGHGVVWLKWRQNKQNGIGLSNVENQS